MNTMESKVPCLFLKDYSDSIKQIVYLSNIDEFYNRIPYRKTTLVNFNDFREKELLFNEFPPAENELLHDGSNFYAYGIMINPLKSNLIGLDFDNVSYNNLTGLIQAFAFKYIDFIRQIDIISTSLNNYHVYIGLEDTFKINEIINTFPNVCVGYKSFSNNNIENVLRVSQKFYGKSRISLPEVKVIIVKENNKLIFLTNICFPTTNVISLKEENINRKIERINLRDVYD